MITLTAHPALEAARTAAKAEADAAAGRAAPPGRPSFAYYRADFRPENGGPGNGAAAGGALVSLPYQHAKTPELPRSKLLVYPYGFRLEDVTKANPAPPDTDNVRGEILGFSARSASRLRRFTLENEVPDFYAYAGTFTVHRHVTPDEFRAIVAAFKMRIVRRGFAMVWRVELQRRGTPHLHGALWSPVGGGADDDEEEHLFEVIRRNWLESTGEDKDAAAKEHAVFWKPILDGGWGAYQALHDGKAKESQLGWKGKQWGVWNRRMFRPIVPECGDLDDQADSEFRVLANLYLQARGARMRMPGQGTCQRLCKPKDIRWLFWWAREATR